MQVVEDSSSRIDDVMEIEIQLRRDVSYEYIAALHPCDHVMERWGLVVTSK